MHFRGVGIGGWALPKDGKVQLGRRVYWTGWAVDTPLFLIATLGDVAKSLVMTGFWISIAIGFAYVCTPYLRIGNTVYAPGFTRRRYAEHLDAPKSR
jgi:hypothetical protein